MTVFVKLIAFLVQKSLDYQIATKLTLKFNGP